MDEMLGLLEAHASEVPPARLAAARSRRQQYSQGVPYRERFE